MKKLLIIIVIAIVLSAGLFYFLSRPSSVDKNTAPAENTAPTVNTVPAETGSPAGSVAPLPNSADSAQVSLINFSFNPQNLKVKLGTNVTWTNNDLAGHLIEADDGSFLSKTISQGESFAHVFNSKGTFSYHCKIHPSMKGVITVE